MSASQEDLDNMTADDAFGYLQTKIYVYTQGIKFCKKMMEKYR